MNDENRAWEDLQASDTPPDKEDLAKWEAEFSQMMNAQRESLDYDYGEGMQQAWEHGAGDLQEDGLREPMKFDDDGLPILGPYEFGELSHLIVRFSRFPDGGVL
jgi:peroxin-5